MPGLLGRLRAVERALSRRGSSAPTTALDRWRADPALLMTDSGLSPDPWQADLLRGDADRLLMLCARQTGKSTSAAFLALKEVILNAGRTVLLVSPSLRQSGELFRRTVDAFNRLGRPVRATAESLTRLDLANGSRVISLPGTEATIRGYTAAKVILDEAARIADPLYYAVRPMLAASGGSLVALSTAFARSGFLYEEWTGSEPWERVRVTAEMCPRIAPAFLAEERRTLGPRWYAMEYGCEFQDVVAAVFSTDDIRAAVADASVAPLFGGPPA